MPARFSRGFTCTKTVTPPCGVNPTEEGSASPFVQVSLSLGDSLCDFVRMPWHSDSAVCCAFRACFSLQCPHPSRGRTAVAFPMRFSCTVLPPASLRSRKTACRPHLSRQQLLTVVPDAFDSRLPLGYRVSVLPPATHPDRSRPFCRAVLPEPKTTNALQFLPAGADMGAGSLRRARRTWLPLDRRRDS